jgi:hypothetical protein
VAATDRAAAGSALAALMQAALALPILAVAPRAGAAIVGEIGAAVVGYKERGLMKATEPILFGRAVIDDVWELQATAVGDILTGASPQYVSNEHGRPVQVLTGASVHDRRHSGDAKVGRRFGDYVVSLSAAVSNERDYHSRAAGIEVKRDFDQRNTTVTFGYGRASDRVHSALDPELDAPRKTDQLLLGVTQVLSPVSLVESSLAWSDGRGWYDDPYKFTLTFFPGDALPLLVPDSRPDHRRSLAWLTRYRRHFPASAGTLQAEYRYFRDDWGVRAHTLEVGWEQQWGERWSLRPALRYYTQGAADFYSPVVTLPQPTALSSDQRLAAFGGLSPSLRATLRLDRVTVEGAVGYVHDAARLRLGGSGSSAFETLRAVYGILSLTFPF